MSKTVGDTFSYFQVEATLGELLQLAPDNLPAFSARLRHLRALNVPSSKPGSGRRLHYERNQVAQMLVALLFQSLGGAPRISAEAAWAAEKHFVVATRNSDVVFAMIDQCEFAVLRGDDVARLVNQGLACVAINLSLALTRLDAVLSHVEQIGSRHARLSPVGKSMTRRV